MGKDMLTDHILYFFREDIVYLGFSFFIKCLCSCISSEVEWTVAWGMRKNISVTYFAVNLPIKIPIMSISVWGCETTNCGKLQGGIIYAKHCILGNNALWADSCFFGREFDARGLHATYSCYSDRHRGLKAECFSPNILNHSVSCFFVYHAVITARLLLLH